MMMIHKYWFYPSQGVAAKRTNEEMNISTKAFGGVDIFLTNPILTILEKKKKKIKKIKSFSLHNSAKYPKHYPILFQILINL